MIKNANNDSSEIIPKSIKNIIYILLLSLLGAILAITYQILFEKDSKNIQTEEISKPDSLQPTGDGVEIKFDNSIRDWNLKAAPYISPLLSQLAREPRKTLGAHKELCKAQLDTLSPLLLLELPDKKNVSKSFSIWRDSVKNALNLCIKYNPTGNDKRDIKFLYNKIVESEKLFQLFLKSQIKDVDVSFDIDPKIFE